MSREIGEYNGITVSEFAGGVRGGICVQLTDCDGYVQLTQYQAYEVTICVLEWLKKQGKVLTYSVTPNIGATRGNP